MGCAGEDFAQRPVSAIIKKISETLDRIKCVDIAQAYQNDVMVAAVAQEVKWVVGGSNPGYP